MLQNNTKENLRNEINQVLNELSTMEYNTKEHKELRTYYLELLKEESAREKLSSESSTRYYETTMKYVAGPLVATALMILLLEGVKTPYWKDLIRFLHL